MLCRTNASFLVRELTTSTRSTIVGGSGSVGRLYSGYCTSSTASSVEVKGKRVKKQSPSSVFESSNKKQEEKQQHLTLEERLSASKAYIKSLVDESDSSRLKRDYFGKLNNNNNRNNNNTYNSNNSNNSNNRYKNNNNNYSNQNNYNNNFNTGNSNNRYNNNNFNRNHNNNSNNSNNNNNNVNYQRKPSESPPNGEYIFDSVLKSQDKRSSNGPSQSIDLYKLSEEFHKVIDPNNTEIKVRVENKEEANIISYRSRIDLEKILYPVVLSNEILDHTFIPLDLTNKLTQINELDYSNIPKLAHGLDRVVTESGVHPVGDFDGSPIFSRFLNQIHDFESLVLHSNYTIPSEDESLLKKTKDHKCKFLSSTSSITSVLTKLYMGVFKKKTVNLSSLNTFYQGFAQFTPQIFRPTSITLVPIENTDIWAININNGTMPKSNQVLMDLGHSLEKMLTLSEEEFESKLLKSLNPTPYEFPDAYVYSKFGDIMYRSQIDCYSDSLKGEKKTFDLKTRATNPIRFNIEDYESYLGYHLKNIMGVQISFEKEFYDLAKSSAIKYSFQAKIGAMAGIFLCYHNTKRIFGSEYLPLEELEDVVFWGRHLSDDIFSVINQALSILLNKVVESGDRRHQYRIFFSIPNFLERGVQVFVEELSTTKQYESQLFSYFKTTERIAKEAKQIINPVKLYNLQIEATLNGHRVNGPLHYNPGDKVQFYYKLTQPQHTRDEITYMYSEVLRESKIYTEFHG